MSRRDHDAPYVTVLAFGLVALLLLPFVTTFNDLLTAAVQTLGFTGPIRAVAPLEARVVAGALSIFGVQASTSGGNVVLPGHVQAMEIAWNCVGWQSLVLLGLSLLTGLRGGYTAAQKLEVVVIGVLGTLMVNIARVTLVILLDATVGYAPAVLFHDYGGTLMVIGWMFIFWHFCQSCILAAEPEVESAP